MEGLADLVTSLPGLGTVGGIIAAIFLLWRRAKKSTTPDVISQRSLEMLEDREKEAMEDAEEHLSVADDLRDRRESIEDPGPVEPRERTEDERLSELDERLAERIRRADDPH